MRILVLTPSPVFPLSHGGRLRVFRLAEGLVRCGAEVDVAGPWAPGQPLRPYRRDGVRVLPRLFATLPLLAVDDYRLPSVISLSWQARFIRGFRDYDIVQVDSPGYASCLERAPAGVYRVYASHNVDRDYAVRRAQGTGPVRQRLAKRVGELERRVVETSDLVLACTSGDRHRFEELYAPSRCEVVPNGFDDALLSLDRTRLRESKRAELGIGPDERLVFFVGSDADQNRRAVAFLETELAPRLDHATRLLVAGKAAGALSGSNGRVLGLGWVADMRPLLAAADVAVNPVNYGSGSHLKIAEYLAAGLPVVTTAVGARGFERWNEWLRIAELDDFPDAIAACPPAGRPPEGIEELAWSRVGRRLHALYAPAAS